MLFSASSRSGLGALVAAGLISFDSGVETVSAPGPCVVSGCENEGFFHVPESDCSKIRGWCARERFSADGAGAPRVCLVGSENVYDTADVIEGVSGLLGVSESVPLQDSGCSEHDCWTSSF